MNSAREVFVVLTLFATCAAAADAAPGVAAHDAPVRSIAEVMAQPPLIAIDNSLRAWAVEKSEDFGVVLVEVLGQIPLHFHPDGNRRMFVLEGRVKMRGGDHEMDMQPGDYMYLPRSHRHEVWLAPGAQRALLLLVDNPPTSAANVVWLEAAPEIRWNRDQVKSALKIGDRYESEASK
jgi:mannose-6-phosphate isomerase-like protein (cupin superfamily)